ncbi:MAG: archaeosortase A [Thermoplasmata archaeon]|nr:archaeosortase A [Thermoplasmata archaeon]
MYLFILYLLLFVSLGCFGVGCFSKKELRYKARIVGYILFGFYWLLYTPHYFYIHDYFPMFLSGTAIIGFAFLAYNEYISLSLNEKNESMEFLAKLIFGAGVVYYVVDCIPVLSAFLIQLVTEQSVWFANLFFMDGVTTGSLNYLGNAQFVRTNFEEIYMEVMWGGKNVVNIVLACTGIQATVVDVFAVVATSSSIKRKFACIGLTIPVIYIVNAMRNAIVIYCTATNYSWFSGVTGFEFAHNFVGKVISFSTLFILTLLMFKILPDFYSKIIGIAELFKRVKNYRNGKSGSRKTITF